MESLAVIKFQKLVHKNFRMAGEVQKALKCSSCISWSLGTCHRVGKSLLNHAIWVPHDQNTWDLHAFSSRRMFLCNMFEYWQKQVNGVVSSLSEVFLIIFSSYFSTNYISGRCSVNTLTRFLKISLLKYYLFSEYNYKYYIIRVLQIKTGPTEGTIVRSLIISL